MPSRPKHAQALVRVYLAKCWLWQNAWNEPPVLAGVHFWDDWLLMACTWFHNFFVEPFRSERFQEGFPIVILEIYDRHVMSWLDVSPYVHR